MNMELTKHWMESQTEKVQGFNLKLIAAMTINHVISMQIVEGGTDAVVFENFLFKTLDSLRWIPANRDKPIVVLMDNATIHKSPVVYNTACKMKVTLMLNSQYSPWLNTTEQLFNKLKRSLRDLSIKPDK